MARMVHRWLTATLAVAAIGLAACGDDNGGKGRTVTVPGDAEQDAPVIGDAILIETRITNIERHTAEVLSESFIGKSAFCPGGKASGGGNPTVITTFRCRDGRLKIRFAPMQRSLVQSAVWEVVRGTGSFAGLRGGGSMVARFESDASENGRETFTGTVGK
jgi:hypothetical protein